MDQVVPYGPSGSRSFATGRVELCFFALRRRQSVYSLNKSEAISIMILLAQKVISSSDHICCEISCAALL